MFMHFVRRAPRCGRLIRWFVLTALVVGGMAMPPARVTLAQAGVVRRSVNAIGPAECVFNGALVRPVVPAGYTWTWAFVANFNHAPLVNQTRACLAIAFAGVSTVQYTVVTCPVEGSLAAPIGGGTVVFDGGGAIRCDLALVSAATPGMFRQQARAILPSGSLTHTLASSDAFSFRASTNPACLTMTLASAYGSLAFQNGTGGICGAYVRLGSAIEKTSASTSSFKGAHFVNGASLGNMSLLGTFGLTQNFSIRIGAAGESFTLDELMVDPPGKCCSPS
jgi:hypothetical protein